MDACTIANWPRSQLNSMVMITLSVVTNERALDSRLFYGLFNHSRLLTQNTHLEILDVGNNEIGDATAKHIAAGLAKNVAMKSLDLDTNLITEVGARQIVGALEKNTVRNMTHTIVCNTQHGAHWLKLARSQVWWKRS